MKYHIPKRRAALMITNAISMLFDFKLVYVINSCYYRMKAHATKAC